jgi:hypothetical protein
LPISFSFSLGAVYLAHAPREMSFCDATPSEFAANVAPIPKWDTIFDI